MSSSNEALPASGRRGVVLNMERVERHILRIRGRRVILDADLAELYGVTTKAINQAVKRNKTRFPADFAFLLNRREKREVVTNCDHLFKLRFSSVKPRAFTEHGAVMAANILNSTKAVRMSVFVVRAFVRLRSVLSTHRKLAQKLIELESRFEARFKVVFEALRELMNPPSEERGERIGFRPRK